MPIPDAQAGPPDHGYNDEFDDPEISYRCRSCLNSYPSARRLSIHEPFCPKAQTSPDDRVVLAEQVISSLEQQIEFLRRENEALRRAIMSV